MAAVLPEHASVMSMWLVEWLAGLILYVNHSGTMHQCCRPQVAALLV